MTGLHLLRPVLMWKKKFLQQKSVPVFFLLLQIFPVFFRGKTGGFSKLAAECGSIFKTAGVTNFRDRVPGVGEHVCCCADPQLNQVLLGGKVFLLHENPVKIRAVNANGICNILDPDVVAVVVIHVFECTVRVLPGKRLLTGNIRSVHDSKKLKKEAGKSKVAAGRTEKCIQNKKHEPFYMILSVPCPGTGINTGILETGMFQKCVHVLPVEADPGVFPGIVFVSLIVGGFHGSNQKCITGFQMIGAVLLSVDSLPGQDNMDQIMRADSGTEGMSGNALFSSAEID